jgi:hypothetical protein
VILEKLASNAVDHARKTANASPDSFVIHIRTNAMMVMLVFPLIPVPRTTLTVAPMFVSERQTVGMAVSLNMAQKIAQLAGLQLL